MPADPSASETRPQSQSASIERPRRRILAIVGGIGLIVLLAMGGFALFGGFDKTTSVRVSGTEKKVVRIALVDAVIGFDVTPDVVEAARGTHVVLDVVNEGGDPHDLAVEGGPATAMLDPGTAQRLDLGTVARDWAAWCTLPDHKAAGMTLEIQVVEPSA